MTILSDRRERGPYGLLGGKPGARGKNSLVGGKRMISIPGKSRFEVKPGDVLRIETPGGSGYGTPA